MANFRFAIPQKVEVGSPKRLGDSKKTKKMNVSDHADVVLKKSDEKILSGDKVMLLYKRVFFCRKLAEARFLLLSLVEPFI